MDLLTWKFWMTPFRERTEKRLLALLSLLALFILLLQTFTHRALLNEGTDLLYKILLNQDFTSLELVRQSFQTLSQWPIASWVKLELPLRDPRLASSLFSLGYYWLHVVSLAVCYFVLPREKKRLFLFPLCQWFFGVALAIGQPTTATLGFISYFWAILFVVSYSSLQSLLSKGLFVLLSLPLIFSHEYVCILGLVLAGVALFRAHHESEGPALLLRVFSAWSLVCALIGGYLALRPTGQTGSFTKSLLSMDFLFLEKAPGVSYLALISVLCTFALLSASIFKKSKAGQITTFLLSYFAVGFSLYFLSQLLDYATILHREVPYEGRAWVIISVPILLIGFWRAGNHKLPRALWTSLTFSALVLTAGYSIGNLYFLRYLEQVQTYLNSCQGYIELTRNPPPNLFQPSMLSQFWSQETGMQLSVLLSPEFKVQTIFSDSDLPAQQEVQKLLSSDRILQHPYYDFSEYLFSVRHGRSGCLNM